ncbi:amino acid deaminase/aldolase [soil metagenome]
MGRLTPAIHFNRRRAVAGRYARATVSRGAKAPSETAPKADLEQLHARYEAIVNGIPGPFAFVDLDAARSNSARMLAQAGDLPIRIASKSIRSTALLRRFTDLDDRYRGVLAFTAREALHLSANGFDDIIVGYPTVDRDAIAEIAAIAAERPQAAPALMVDEESHLDLIESTIGAGRTSIPVVIDIDTSWWPGRGRVARVGPKRSSIRTPQKAGQFAAQIAERPGLHLRGVMAYEGQIAGVGDNVSGKPLRSAAIRQMQSRSLDELRQRLPEVIAAIRDAASEPAVINCGGTGSLARSRQLGVANELTAGSGFYAPALFDSYRSLDLTPAAFFCLPIVRRPHPGVVTALGGGYVASGAPGGDRLPLPYPPRGLGYDSDEGAGEVQTPLVGAAARELRVGDRVYMRHAKAGELCERFDSLLVVEGDRVVDEVPTYRGEGKAFL